MPQSIQILALGTLSPDCLDAIIAFGGPELGTLQDIPIIHLDQGFYLSLCSCRSYPKSFTLGPFNFEILGALCPVESLSAWRAVPIQKARVPFFSFSFVILGSSLFGSTA